MPDVALERFDSYPQEKGMVVSKDTHFYYQLTIPLSHGGFLAT